MKRLGLMIFGYLILSMALGNAQNIAHSHFAARAVADPAPQGGTVPVGLPAGTAHSMSITWTASTPVSGVTVAGYNVYRSATAGGEAGTQAINGSTVVSGTSYTDSNVAAGTKYFYVVAAQSTNGNQSGFSNEASATIPSNPSNPTGCNTAAQ